MTKKRREFTPKTKLKAWENSKGYCANCDIEIFGNPHYDHIIPCGLDGGNDLENCQVLCRNCHGAKTDKAIDGDKAKIAKSKRVKAKHIGVEKRKQSFPGGRDSKWKKKINGSVVPR